MSSQDPHARPPEEMKELFKKYQKLDPTQYHLVQGLIDFENAGQNTDRITAQRSLTSSQLLPLFHNFAGGRSCEDLVVEDKVVYSFEALPGLLMIPALLPPEIQQIMLQRLLHGNLSDPKHQTNLHLHYDIPYPDTEDDLASDKPTSFFSLSPKSSVKFQPKHPDIHKPLSISQVLQKKLRWMTLGGQYDWTKKVYPKETPPAFPADLATLLEGLFPDMKAQAAIVNLYSPGDTLSLHRDVSEECDSGLISISLGCDCIFLVGLENHKSSSDAGNGSEKQTGAYAAMRLRSGDAIYMSRESRFAWHGVPKIIANTCPSYLENWPADSGGHFEEWRGWMRNKRVNLNVRQMFE